MSEIEIERVAKDYLNSKNIRFEAETEKDECRLIIKKINNVFYVEVRCSFFLSVYSTLERSCRFVINENGTVIIDIAMIAAVASDSFDCLIKPLDEENVIIPIIDDEICLLNNFQHFRIQNGKAVLINTLKWNLGEILLEDKLLVGKQLYNFEKGVFLRDEFDAFYTGTKWELQELAMRWRIPQKERKTFIDTIAKKMKQENLIGAYKEIEVKKEGYQVTNTAFIFIDKNGNLASSLYYVDDYELIPIDTISPENTLHLLEKILTSKVDAMIAAKKAKEEKEDRFLQQLKVEFKV